MELNYKHVGYYNDAKDIIDLFPNFILKGDEADIIMKHIKDGLGHYYQVDNGTEETLDGFDTNFKNETAILTNDKKYIVTFIEGDKKALLKGDECHGYYIDVWEAIDEENQENEVLAELYDHALSLTEQLKGVIEKIKRLEALGKE
jgi:hypothetical protein